MLPWRSQSWFYRTAAGAEIDLIIEHASGALWAIEIKRSIAGKIDRGFYAACEDLKPQRALVVHAENGRYPLTETIESVGLYEAIALLKKAE